MNCSCTAMSVELEDAYWSERKLRAAKLHKCIECGCKIKKEEYFIFGTYIIPGVHIHNSITCLDCKSIQENFFSEGWNIGSLKNDLYNYFDSSWIEDLPSKCISKLTPKARDTVCDLLQEFQEK
jgi:hypothetical protein